MALSMSIVQSIVFPMCQFSMLFSLRLTFVKNLVFSVFISHLRWAGRIQVIHTYVYTIGVNLQPHSQVWT